MSFIKEGNIIKGATPSSIMKYFLCESLDRENLDPFIAAFPQFMSSSEVWNLWKEQ